MTYELMHHDIVVAKLNLDEFTGSLFGDVRIVNSDHMPLGTITKGGFLDKMRLNSWWINRSIPASRPGIRELLEKLDIPVTTALLMKSMGLSLSDHYWIRTEGTDVRWDDVNFFKNPFSEDLGDMLVGGMFEKGTINLSSPDATSDGNLRKRWKIVDGKRCLLKGGTPILYQEPVNEAVASMIAADIGIEHIDYQIGGC